MVSHLSHWEGKWQIEANLWSLAQNLWAPFFCWKASLPRLGTTTHDTCNEDTYSTLLQRYQRSEEELHRVAEEWLECQKRIDAYVDEQVSVHCQNLLCGRHMCQWGGGGASRGLPATDFPEETDPGSTADDPHLAVPAGSSSWSGHYQSGHAYCHLHRLPPRLSVTCRSLWGLGLLILVISGTIYWTFCCLEPRDAQRSVTFRACSLSVPDCLERECRHEHTQRCLAGGLQGWRTEKAGCCCWR